MIYSYSFLNTWNICPHQCARRYIVKDIETQANTAEGAWGRIVHKAAAERINKKVPLPQGMEQWEPFFSPLDRKSIRPEQWMGLTSDGHACESHDRNVWLRVVADCPIVNTEHALLLDWKTGKAREDPFELEIQALALKARKPRLKKIVGRYVWLKECRLGEEHDCSDTERTFRMVSGIVRDIETAHIEGEYVKTPGPLCYWCPVQDCEHNRSDEIPPWENRKSSP